MENDEEAIWFSEVSVSIERSGTVSTGDRSQKSEMREFGYSEEELEWREKALCRGMDHRVFFPDRGHTMLPAYAICQGCSVRWECLQDSIDNRDDHGIRAGFTPHERKVIRKELKKGIRLKKAAEVFDVKRYRKLIKARRRQQFQTIAS